MTPAIRPAAVAGSFYPADPTVLRRDVAAYLSAAVPLASTPESVPPLALIVPHAGYIYSAPVAARAFAALAARRGRIDRVLLIGPCHRVAVRGIAIPATAAFVTPLGHVPVDQAGLDAVRTLPQVTVSDEAHAAEHALEVQLPFLQQVLGEFRLLPLAVGQASSEEVAEVIERLWADDRTLPVISSDLSHYLAYGAAQARDRQTADDICAGRLLTRFDQACGALPVNGLMMVAARRGLDIRLLDLRNSGDTAGDRSRVVGYAAFAVIAPPAAMKASSEASSADAQPDTETVLGSTLLAMARQAIASQLGIVSTAPRPDPALQPALAAPGASFVTLQQNGQLRGCIGSLEAHRPLAEDVTANARAAAFADPRFAPVSAADYPGLTVEVSLLTPAVLLPCRSEGEALQALRPHEDGLIFSWRGHRSTFLPQVWEQLPDPALFLRQLRLKAGLPGDFWADDVVLSRYRVRKWKESRQA